MAKEPASSTTLRRRRRRLFNRLEPLLQLDLFRGLDDNTERAITELKAAITKTSRELDELEIRVA